VRVECECAVTPSELNGVQADDFSRGHLSEDWVNVVQWTAGFTCPETGQRWLRDSPHSELHGGGPPRLRRVSEAEFVSARDA
jgi:hypothetical protein